MIRKLLIANRGEIAVRIIRACREMGIEAVAVYSEADKESLHTQLADEAICIGPGPSVKSYLNMESIISAAIVSGADAIHPGFGFLSENARFAQICEQCGITFVGPPSQVIQNLGNKQIARNTMEAAGVPVIPGTTKAILDVETGAREASQIGYPVIIKAALPSLRRILNWHFLQPRRNLRSHLEMEPCISSILWNIPDILNFRSLQTVMEM